MTNIKGHPQQKERERERDGGESERKRTHTDIHTVSAGEMANVYCSSRLAVDPVNGNDLSP